MSHAAELVFERLVGALSEGSSDPETLFSAHPDLERELWDLYRGWRRVDSLFRELAEGSAVRAALAELAPETNGEEQARILGTIQRARPFAERYELRDELGRGGMGIVRRVRDRLLGRELAMKVVRERGGDAARLRLLRRFLAEAEVTGRLQHPSIPPIHDLGIDESGCVYFTMPVVEGETLERVLERARAGDPRWTLARVLEVLIKVGDALAYAHSRGVLHRDLKPSNVIVGAFGEAYVLDWGLARALDERAAPAGGATDDFAAGTGERGAITLEGEVVGTPAYMAPEQANGAAPDARCDVYSLGAVLYEALAGHRPYSAPGLERGPAETLEMRGKGDPESIDVVAPRAPAALRAVVRAAMSTKPDERYAGVAALCSDLRAYLDGRVVSKHESGRWAEARAWLRRNRRLAAAVTLGVAASAIGGGVSLGLHARNARLEHAATRAARRDARAALRVELARLRSPERIGGEILVDWVEPARVEAPLPQGLVLREDVEVAQRRYREALSRAGVASLSSDLPALYSDAARNERDALLDELYWYELHLARAQPGDATAAELLGELGALANEWEEREWPRALREAWFARRRGDVLAFAPLLEDAWLASATAAELEWLAVLLAASGDQPSAHDVLERANTLDRGRFAVHFQLGPLTHGVQRLQHAHAATVLNPLSGRALYNYAWNFQNIQSPPFGDSSVAEPAYRKALELDPDLWEAALNLTYLVEPDEAIALMEAAIARTPRAILYLRLAERWRSSSDAARGAVVCEEALARYPDDPGLWGMLGECLGWTRRWQESADALERAIALDPDQPAAHSNLCVALASLSEAEPDPARRAELDRRNLEVAERAHALFPERAEIAEKLGIAHCNLGDLATGARHLLRSLELGNANAPGFLSALRAELARSPEHASLVGEIDAALGE